MEELDRALTLAINSVHTPGSDAFWIFMSKNAVAAVVYIAVIALMFWRLGWKKALLMVVTTAIVIGLEDQCCNLIKDGVARLRPCNDPVMIERGIYLPIPPSRHIYGFPSAHSAASFAFLTCVVFFLSMDERLREKGCHLKAAVTCTLVIWASLVALSRIFLARHFVGDIIVGAVFGYAIAHLTCLLSKNLYERSTKLKSKK